MILASTELVPRSDSREALLEVLRFVQERVQGKAGCLQSQVFEAADGSHVILYLECWDSARALHAHIQSSLYLRLLHAMDLAAEKPRISFHAIAQTESMELIEALRAALRTEGVR